MLVGIYVYTILIEEIHALQNIPLFQLNYLNNANGVYNYHNTNMLMLHKCTYYILGKYVFI